MALNFVYWNFGFLRMSTTGITARAYGAGDATGQLLTLRRGGLVAAAIAVTLLLLQVPLAQLTHRLLNLQPGQVGLVDDYFYVRIWAAPAALLQMVLFGWFFGRQNATFPLLLTLLVNGANMALSYYLVRVLEWDIRGVAWGTVASQYLGLVAGLGLWWWEMRRHGLRFAELRSHPRTRPEDADRAADRGPTLGDFLRINADIFVRTVCLTLSFAFFYNRANALDQVVAVVAANVILLQLVNWLSYGVDGLAFAAESLVGKYAGAGRRAELRRLVRLLFLWALVFSLLYAAVYGWGRDLILPLFAPRASAAETLAAAGEYLPVVILFCLLATPCYLFDGIFVGLTASRAMRQTMLFAFAGYLLAYYLVGRHYGNWGLWGSLLVFMMLRGILQLIWLASGRVKLA